MNSEKGHLKRKRNQNKHDKNKRKIEEKDSGECSIVTECEIKESNVNSKIDS